jgi:hypothetical protein
VERVACLLKSKPVMTDFSRFTLIPDHAQKSDTTGKHNLFHHPNSMNDPCHCCLEETGVEQGL